MSSRHANFSSWAISASRSRLGPAELEKIKDNLRQAIANQRQRELSAAWLGELRQRADVEIDEQVL